MSEVSPNTTERTQSKNRRIVTHFYSKSDIMMIWNITDHPQFVKMIGAKGVKILGWKKGQQRFTPKQVRELISHVGEPLTEEEFRPLRNKVPATKIV